MSKLAIDGGTPVRSTPLTAPPREIGEPELEQLRRVIEAQVMNRWSGGKLTDELEEAFARFYGTKMAVASTSGTAAIHVAVGALNPEPGDEIITAPITDLGTIIPIVAQNAIPVFADVDPHTFTMDPADFERRITPRTKAVIPVHLGGNPCDMDRVLEIARRHGLMVIEDCSQCYCATYRGKWTGQLGDFGCFSLQQTKHMTSGDGGITITNNTELGELAKKFGAKGRPLYTADGARHYHSFGFNYNMTDLQAAVALAQLQRVQGVTEARTRNGERLTTFLNGLPGVHPQKVLDGCRSTYWFYAMRLTEAEAGMSPRRFADCMRAEGVPCGVHYIGKPIFLYDSLRTKQVYGTSHYPWSLQDPAHAVRYEEGECPNTELVLNEMITIPLHEKYTDQDVQDIADAATKILTV